MKTKEKIIVTLFIILAATTIVEFVILDCPWKPNGQIFTLIYLVFTIAEAMRTLWKK